MRRISSLPAGVADAGRALSAEQATTAAAVHVTAAGARQPAVPLRVSCSSIDADDHSRYLDAAASMPEHIETEIASAGAPRAACA